jgi:hypothetical protein
VIPVRYELDLYILIGLCILLRVYQSISIETSVRTNVGAQFSVHQHLLHTEVSILIDRFVYVI